MPVRDVQSNAQDIATEATLSTVAGDTTSIDGKIPADPAREGGNLATVATALTVGPVPISAAALPLPAGAATEVTLATVAADTTSLDGKVPADPAREGGNLQTVATALTVGPVPISAAALPLPAGAATEATLVTLATQATLAALQTLLAGGLPAALGAGGGLKVDGSGTSLPVTASVTGATVKGTIAQGAAASDAPVVIGAEDDSGYVNTVRSDNNGNLLTMSADARSPFGEPVITQITPVVQIQFTYGVNPLEVTSLKSSGGSITASGAGGPPATSDGSDLVVAIDNAANAFAVARSALAVHYRTGVGIIGRFTAAYNTGVADSRQFAGLWAPDAEYTIGYSGTVWGVFAKIGGMQAVYSITVTGGATAAANCTITLDGRAFVVALTNVGAPATTATAWEISQGTYNTASGADWGWNAYTRGAVVYFVARRARATAGAFTFAAGATGATATGPTEQRRGDAESINFGSPATPGNFVFIDPLDGTGPSGLNLTKTNSIIYEIQVGHLGHRGADYFTIDVATRLPVWFARFNYHNTATTNALQNATLYLASGIEANGSATAMTLRSGSWMGGHMGRVNDEEGRDWFASAGKNAVNGVSVHYVSVRCGPVAGYGGQTVKAARPELHVHEITVTCTGGSSGQYVDVAVIRNGTYTNAANFSAILATSYAAWRWQDTTTTTATLTGGTQTASPRVSTGSTQTFKVHYKLEAGETIGINITASAVNLVVDVNMIGIEVD